MMLRRILPFVVCIAVVAPALAIAQGRGRGGQPAAPPQTARQIAPIDLTGYWVSLIVDNTRRRFDPYVVPQAPLKPTFPLPFSHSLSGTSPERAAKSTVWQSLQPPTMSMYFPRSIALRLVDAAGFFAGAVSAAVVAFDAVMSATVAAIVTKGRFMVMAIVRRRRYS